MLPRLKLFHRWFGPYLSGLERYHARLYCVGESVFQPIKWKPGDRNLDMRYSKTSTAFSDYLGVVMDLFLLNISREGLDTWESYTKVLSPWYIAASQSQFYFCLSWRCTAVWILKSESVRWTNIVQLDANISVFLRHAKKQSKNEGVESLKLRLRYLQVFTIPLFIITIIIGLTPFFVLHALPQIPCIHSCGFWILELFR